MTSYLFLSGFHQTYKHIQQLFSSCLNQNFYQHFIIFLQKNTSIFMGCAPIFPLNSVNNSLFDKTQIIVGELTLKIKSFKLEKQFFQKNINSFVKLSMSNQQFKSSIKNDNGRLIALDDTFKFCINSMNKTYGRILATQIFNNQSIKSKDVAFGLLDLNRYINIQQSMLRHEEKIYLDFQTKSAGHINVFIYFQPFPYEKINFRIDTVFIRKNTNSHRDCFARINIGQQIQQTSIKKDSIDSVPTWKNEQKIFVVPSFISEASIQILQRKVNSDEILGQVTLDIKLLLSTHKPLMHNQALYFNNKIIGSIIFDTVKNKDHGFQFLELLSPRLILKPQSKHISFRQNNKLQYSQNMLLSQTYNNCSLLKPPLISPENLPQIDDKKFKKFGESEQTFQKSRNYSNVEESQNQQIIQIENYDKIKIIQIPSPLVRKQIQAIRRNSLDLFQINLIQTIENNLQDENQSSNSQTKISSQAKSQNLSKNQESNQQNISNKNLINCKISPILTQQDDTFQNQSGNEVLKELSNAMNFQLRNRIEQK